jgi:hypothetical protein
VTFNLTVPMVAMHCYKCGIPFAVPTDWDAQRYYDHREFWCPNGHGQTYAKPETPPKPGASLEDQELVLALHRAEQAEAKAAEASGKPPTDPPAVDDPEPPAAAPTPGGKTDPKTVPFDRVVVRSPAGTLLCVECNKAYKYAAAMRKHLCDVHGLAYPR